MGCKVGGKIKLWGQREDHRGRRSGHSWWRMLNWSTTLDVWRNWRFAVGVWTADVGVYMIAVPVPVVDADIGVCMLPLLGLEFVVGRGAEGVDTLFAIPPRLGPCK